ncbi:hypothetical protein [Solirubrum puertoriconensis]|uniref:Uncharacterized protein n=1 Tax=Solirubrum puertoriconensis TaxID=1751427 RepID=A0A9X0HPI6_SOLP1|nr:hypothetical protein [Solirubrum puertoriconensis]KUG09736.1 hypothetical protein ASU33_18820 [Solirubrum puertoriconensis]
MWKRVSSLAGLLFVLLLGSPNAQAQTWMVSTDPFVKIGVADKFGQLGAYKAKFTVTSQSTGKTYTLVKEVQNGQNGVDVVFPSPATEADFFQTENGIAANSAPGDYTWICEVSGKRAGGGRFSLPAVSNDVTVVERAKK